MLSPEIAYDACSCPVTAVLVICLAEQNTVTRDLQDLLAVFAVLVCNRCVDRSHLRVFAKVCCSAKVYSRTHGDGRHSATVALLARRRMCCGWVPFTQPAFNQRPDSQTPPSAPERTAFFLLHIPPRAQIDRTNQFTSYLRPLWRQILMRACCVRGASGDADWGLKLTE